MAMNRYGIVKRLDILKNQTVSMIEVADPESVQPLTFYDCVERFNASIIIGISSEAITAQHICRSLPICF